MTPHALPLVSSLRQSKSDSVKYPGAQHDSVVALSRGRRISGATGASMRNIWIRPHRDCLHTRAHLPAAMHNPRSAASRSYANSGLTIPTYHVMPHIDRRVRTLSGVPQSLNTKSLPPILTLEHIVAVHVTDIRFSSGRPPDTGRELLYAVTHRQYDVPHEITWVFFCFRILFLVQLSGIYGQAMGRMTATPHRPLVFYDAGTSPALICQMPMSSILVEWCAGHPLLLCSARTLLPPSQALFPSSFGQYVWVLWSFFLQQIVQTPISSSIESELILSSGSKCASDTSKWIGNDTSKRLHPQYHRRLHCRSDRCQHRCQYCSSYQAFNTRLSVKSEQ